MFEPDSYETKDSQGQLIELCVVCELDPNHEVSRPAVTTLVGFSVCRFHLHSLAYKMELGYGQRELVKLMKEGRF